MKEKRRVNTGKNKDRRRTEGHERQKKEKENDIQDMRLLCRLY